jgi:SSS family solute:Na+ symporter
VLIWLLLAGEQYTTYTFLGASGWANSRGGPVLYVIGVQPLIFVVSFYILPQVWEAGQKHRCGTCVSPKVDSFGNPMGCKIVWG